MNSKYICSLSLVNMTKIIVLFVTRGVGRLGERKCTFYADNFLVKAKNRCAAVVELKYQAVD